MFIEPSVPDLANDLKQLALQEVIQNKIISNIFVLMKYANPYAIRNMIIIEDYMGIRVFYCNDLVFYTVNCDLKKYICGDWTNILSNEAEKIQNRQRWIVAQDNMQFYSNKIAMQNYVVG
jgi:hypothetical protein